VLPGHLVHGVTAVGLVAALVTTTGDAGAQPRGVATEDEREQAFVESIRRDDPASADRYLELRNARSAALADLRKAELQYNNAHPEMRRLFVNGVRQARRRYGETALALLDFLDAHDRGNVLRYQDEIGKLNAVIEERKKVRAELEKLVAP